MENIISIFPAANAGVAAEHPVGQRPQAFAAEFDDPITGREIASCQLAEGGGKGSTEGVVVIHINRSPEPKSRKKN